MKFTDSKGNLRSIVALLVGLSGAVLVILPLYMQWHPYVVIPAMAVGISLMVFSSYANQSATLDLRAFTNDPLGWRKAKASYKKEVQAEEKVDKP